VESSPLISAGLPIALFIIMIGIGMTLTIRDFRQVAVYPKGMIVGTIAQILVMPLIAFMLATLLAVLIVALVYGVRDQIWELLKQAGPATILLNLAGIGLGLAAGRMAGLTQRESLAVAVELGVKNGTIALMVTLTLLESSAMSIPAAVYGVLMFPIGFVLAMYGRSIIPISTVQSKN